MTDDPQKKKEQRRRKRHAERKLKDAQRRVTRAERSVTHWKRILSDIEHETMRAIQPTLWPESEIAQKD